MFLSTKSYLLIFVLLLQLCTAREIAPATSNNADCSDNSVSIETVEAGDKVKLMVTTTRCLDITIELNAELTNFQSSQPLPITVDSNGRRTFEIVSFTKINNKKPTNFNYKFHWKPGGRSRLPVSNYTYALPYSADESYKVIQGFLGTYSHFQGSQDEYAIDWVMPTGTGVCAVRDGVVVGMRADSDEGGPERQYRTCDNYLIIKHDDETYAEYRHLKVNGSLVRLGQRVRRGEKIGLSGSTGFSSAPHLHFALFRTNDGYSRTTIPIEFQDKSGKAIKVVQGETY